MSIATIAITIWLLGTPALLYLGFCLGANSADRRRASEKKRIWRREMEKFPQVVQAGRKVKI
jgi:hypothetical protein